MSDNAIAVKLIVVLAFVILLANLMGVGAQSPFGSLQAAITAGPAIPNFEDPFALREFIAHIAIPVESAEGQTTLGITDGVTVGCTQVNYWECINSVDGNDSYIRMPPPTVPLGIPRIDPVRVTSHPEQPADFRVSRVTIEIQARTTADNATLEIALWNAPAGSSVFNISIPKNPSANGPFHNETYNIIPVGNVNWSAYPQDIITYGSAGPTVTGFIDLSFVRVSFYAGAHPDCAAPPGSWFPALDITGCQIAQFVDWLITAIQWLVAATIFVLSTIGAWAVWIGTIVASFISGVISLALWFLDLDAPPSIQGIFAIITVVVIGFFFLVFIKLARG